MLDPIREEGESIVVKPEPVDPQPHFRIVRNEEGGGGVLTILGPADRFPHTRPASDQRAVANLEGQKLIILYNEHHEGCRKLPAGEAPLHRYSGKPIAKFIDPTYDLLITWQGFMLSEPGANTGGKAAAHKRGTLPTMSRTAGAIRDDDTDCAMR